MRILVTGGCGFIGHHFVEHLMKTTDWKIILLERFSHAGNLDRISDIKVFSSNSHRVEVNWHDLRSPLNDPLIKRIGEVDYIVHFAASTHVDNSIHNPSQFVLDNVLGTQHMLDFCMTLKGLKAFINFSTDEVYGPAPDGVYHKEGDPHNPTNPYAASKSAQEQMGKAAFVTHGVPVITTHTMNNFGERQNPEKFLPKLIRSIIRGDEMPVFADVDSAGNVVKDRIGSRCWIHARNTANALTFLLKFGKPGQEYNIISDDEFNLVEMGEKVAEILGRPFIPKYVGFYNARPGHDRRYALCGNKLAGLGWRAPMRFEECLEKTVKWSVDHPQWL